MASAACAATPDAVPPPILVQVLRPGADEFDADAWSVPLERHPRVVRAYLAEVVVTGIWSVVFELDPAEEDWFRALRREHGACCVTWNGLQLLTDGRTGYIRDMQGKAHAEQVLAQPPWSAVRSDPAGR